MDVGGIYLQNVIVLGGRPHVCEQGLHCPDVTQVGRVGEAVLSVGQKRCGHERQHAVLCPADLHFSIKWDPSFDNQLIHKLLPFAADVQDTFYA